MAPIPHHSLWTLARELILTISQVPFGIAAGALVERVSRCPGRRARLRNTAVKILMAHVSASVIIFGYRAPLSWRAWGANVAHDDDGTSRESVSAGILAVLVIRLLLFVAGTIGGAVLQPVGLTGGIATGKSTVSGLLRSPSSSNPRNDDDDADGKNEGEGAAEFVVIDVDGIAHDILLPPKSAGDESVYDRLVSEFGTEILTKDDGDGSPPAIDRRKLGELVFPHRQKRKKLNSITHPKIIKIMVKRIYLEGINARWQAGGRPRAVCVDIPLLFEGGLPMRLLFGTIIVVACNSALQLERLRKRNPDLSLEQCRHRIASQIPVEEKARKAHAVIRNDGSLEELKVRVRQVKEDVADMMYGLRRGVEFHWLVVGLGAFFLTWCM